MIVLTFIFFADRHALEDNSPAHNVLLLRIADKNFVKVKLNLQPTVNVTAPAYDLDCFIKVHVFSFRKRSKRKTC